jgi:Glycosyltransferase family 87
MSDRPLASPIRRVLVVAVGVVAIGLLAWKLTTLGETTLFKPYDFVEYWAAGRLALDAQNPYDAEALLPLQRRIGWESSNEALMMWNPPWALPLVMPLGAMKPAIAQLVWFVLSLGAVLLCADLLWRGFGGPPDYRWAGWLVALVFAPTLFVQMMGQISALLLLGFVGFAFALKANRPALAGAAAALTALKPHLFAIFAVLFLLESLRHRRTFRAAATGAAILAVCALVPLLWVSDVWSQYRAATTRETGDAHVRTADWHQPTVGYVLREQMPGEPFWVQFVPFGVALVAAPIYWWARRHRWDWVEESPRLSLVFALTAAYGAWAFDLVILLPAVLWMAVRLVQFGRPLLTALFAGAYALINLACALTITRPLSQDNPWIAPTVLVGFVVVSLLPSRSVQSSG